MRLLLGRVARTAVAIGALSVAGSVQATVAIPVSGAMSLHALAILGTGPVSDSQLSTDGWAGAPADLAVAASATAIDGSYYARVSGSATAHWFSADQGEVIFSDYSWDYKAYPYSTSQVSLCGKWCGSPPDWSYTFVSNVDGGIRMTYDVVGQGQPSLWGWVWGGDGCCAYAEIGADGVHSTGLFAYPISAGQTYTVALGNNAYRSGGLDTGATSMDGVFRWTISTQGVPEPATWAAMLVGFGCVGAMMRRERSAAPSAA